MAISPEASRSITHDGRDLLRSGLAATGATNEHSSMSSQVSDAPEYLLGSENTLHNLVSKPAVGFRT